LKNAGENNSWLPILAGKEAEEVFTIVSDIARALHHPPPAWVPQKDDAAEPYRIARGASLGHGASGISLFMAYLAQVPGSDTVLPHEADGFISYACDALEAVPMPWGLYRGFSGIAWTIQHLQGLLYCGNSHDPGTDPNQEIDRILLDQWTKPGKFDLWEGCIGPGVYALERHFHPESKLLLELVISHLNQLSIQSNNGITWLTLPGNLKPRVRLVYPQGFYDLGVAHGITGVISFLSRVLKLDILPDLTGKMLDGAVSWLLAQQGKSDSELIFPHYLLPPKDIPRSTGTFGWCHGDLGIAAALLTAADRTGESFWKTKAVEAARASIKYLNRLSVDTSFSNPCLCHGTAGLGHLFNRIYQATGVEAFKEEAVKWFRQTIKIREPGTGIAGFIGYGMNEDGEISELYDPGFIQGAAGIGLALLASVTDIEPGWDRIMLISA
jgi:lantibiotic modifying enzyme